MKFAMKMKFVMKVIRIILIILGLICSGVFAYEELVHQDWREKVFAGRYADDRISAVAFMGAMFFFGAASLSLLIKYLREKQKKAAIPGLFLALTWGTAIIVALAFTYGGVGWGHTVSRYKTPDGRHTIYYTSDEIIGSGYKDCYRRTGFLTYEYIFTAEDLDKGVTWGSSSITYHGDEYKYSTYGE